jgi:uncharacterized membrane protein (GlpM family)
VKDVLILAAKGLAGGLLVVAFALLSEGLSPKRFAGLFSAAPAVAIAGLTITVLDKGAHDAHESAAGMIAGGVGMVAYAAAVIPLLRRTRALTSAAVALSAWLVVAVAVALPLLLI